MGINFYRNQNGVHSSSHSPLSTKLTNTPPIQSSFIRINVKCLQSTSLQEGLANEHKDNGANNCGDDSDHRMHVE